MVNSLVSRFKSIVDASRKNNEDNVVHHVTRGTMRRYKQEIIDILEESGLSFYEDKPFRDKMVKEYSDKMVCQGILELKIIKENRHDNIK